MGRECSKAPPSGSSYLGPARDGRHADHSPMLTGAAPAVHPQLAPRIRAVNRAQSRTLLRRWLLAAARATGQESRLRALRHVVEPEASRRARRDHELFSVLCAATLHPDSNCIDVGANVGETLREIVRVAPHGRHVAFEPIPELAAKLRAAFPEVDVHAEAVGDSAATVEFVQDLDDPALSGFPRRWHQPARPRMLTVIRRRLDDVVVSNDPIALLKVDVEGAEMAALRGARKLLARFGPVLVFEHCDPAHTAELLGFLADLGYAVFDMDGSGPYDLARMLESTTSGSRSNWFARRVTAGAESAVS